MTTPTDTPRRGRCPICDQDTVAAFRPFCSRACANVDLMRWLKGGYAISGGGADADEDGEDTAAGRSQAAQRRDDDGEGPR